MMTLDEILIEKAKRLSKRIHPKHNFEGHIIPVVSIAKELSDGLHIRTDIVEVSAYLHDAGRVVFGCNRHDLTGAYYAGFKLWQYGFPKEDRRHIVDCIRTHRGTAEMPPKTDEAKIIANADALSHFEGALYEFGIKYKNSGSLAETCDWLEKKLVYDFGHKLTIKEAKEMAEERYEKNIRPLLEAMRRYGGL